MNCYNNIVKCSNWTIRACSWRIYVLACSFEQVNSRKFLLIIIMTKWHYFSRGRVRFNVGCYLFSLLCVLILMRWRETQPDKLSRKSQRGIDVVEGTHFESATKDQKGLAWNGNRYRWLDSYIHRQKDRSTNFFRNWTVTRTGLGISAVRFGSATTGYMVWRCAVNMILSLTSMVASLPRTVTLQSPLKFPSSVFPWADFQVMLVVVINSVTITIFLSQTKTKIILLNKQIVTGEQELLVWQCPGRNPR